MAALEPAENFLNKKLGRLTITEDLGRDNLHKKRMIRAICDCGVVKDYLYMRLKYGQTKSCGCILKENRYGVEFINQTVITDDSKVCVMCKLLKPKNEYHKGVKKSGVQSRCKECTTIYKKGRYWANHESELAKHTKSRTKPENVLQRRAYYHKNKKECRERYLRYVSNEENLKKRKQKSKQYHKMRYKTDPQYNILIKIRARIRGELRKNRVKRSNKTMVYLECTYLFLKEYIESKFTEGMSWELVLSSHIHLDHIRPCSKFDLTNPEEQKKCFHYSNLQPLWAIDNLKKNANYQENE